MSLHVWKPKLEPALIFMKSKLARAKKWRIAETFIGSLIMWSSSELFFSFRNSWCNMHWWYFIRYIRQIDNFVILWSRLQYTFEVQSNWKENYGIKMSVVSCSSLLTFTSKQQSRSLFYVKVKKFLFIKNLS